MFRVVRGFFVAQVCLALSVGSHALAEGPVHFTAETLVGWLLLSAMCVAAAQRKQRLAGIVATVSFSQVALHLMMMPPNHTEHSMHGEVATSMPSPAMIGGHVVATVLASVLLAHGERLAWALWGLASLPWVPSVLRSGPAVVGPAPIDDGGRAPGDGRILPGGATRRGPPGA